MKASYELTDTFCGEANYSWVKRGEVTAKTNAGLIRMIKKELDMTNVRCKKEIWGDQIVLKPIGYCQILFIKN